MKSHKITKESTPSLSGEGGGEGLQEQGTALPDDFIQLMRQQLGDEQADSLFLGLNEPPTIAVRFNKQKIGNLTLSHEVISDPVRWCPDAYYIAERKAFTFDPLFHAGAYYVQDASSMYLSYVLRQFMPTDRPIYALDLCAAPGGKSTLIASHLPEGSMLISNEPIRKRAQVLAENMQKWGCENCFVTQNYPQEFTHLSHTFDFILTDVPCSGEGMFRKDEETVRQWSLDNVRQCAERQREILRSILPTLRPGGLLVYSTCTFNRFEDEDQVLWLQQEYGLSMLDERHFFPGRDRGEGLYMATLRLTSEEETLPKNTGPKSLKTLNVIANVSEYNGQWRQDNIQLELSYEDAIRYLRREALHISLPRGLVTVTYRGLPLGLAKSVGARLNNLYPQEWRIRTTYNPTAEPIPNFFI